jgi:hypothetical protein
MVVQEEEGEQSGEGVVDGADTTEKETSPNEGGENVGDEAMAGGDSVVGEGSVAEAEGSSSPEKRSDTIEGSEVPEKKTTEEVNVKELAAMLSENPDFFQLVRSLRETSSSEKKSSGEGKVEEAGGISLGSSQNGTEETLSTGKSVAKSILAAAPSPSVSQGNEGIRHNLLRKGKGVAEQIKRKRNVGVVERLRDHNSPGLNEWDRGKSSSKKKRIARDVASDSGVRKRAKKSPAVKRNQYWKEVVGRFLKREDVSVPEEYETAGNYEVIGKTLLKSLELFKGSSRGKKSDINTGFYDAMFEAVKGSDAVIYMKVFVACDPQFSAMVQGVEDVLAYKWERERWNVINTKNNLFGLVGDMRPMFLPDKVISREGVMHPLEDHAQYTSTEFLVSSVDGSAFGINVIVNVDIVCACRLRIKCIGDVRY